MSQRAMDKMHCYCLFCNTTKCRSIASLLPKRFACRAIFPQLVQRKWVKGGCCQEVRDLLPGYVFLYAEEPLWAYDEVRAVDGVLRLLGRQEDGYRLSGEDERFAQMLLKNDGVIGILSAYAVGDRIRLTAESLPGYEGEILKVDRRKGRAQILIRFDEKEIKLWVGFDLIDGGKEPAGGALKAAGLNGDKDDDRF